METQFRIKAHGDIIHVDKSFIKNNYPSFLNSLENKHLENPDSKDNNVYDIKIDSLLESVDWVYNLKMTFLDHLMTLDIQTKLKPGKDGNYLNLVSLLNFARFNKKYGTNKNVNLAIDLIKEYFKPENYVSFICRDYLISLFKDLHILWLFPDFNDELKTILCDYTKIVMASYSSGNGLCSFTNYLVGQIQNDRNQILKSITVEMFYDIMQGILDEFKKLNPFKNHLFNVQTMYAMPFNPIVLNALPFKKTLGYLDNEQITFSIKKLQERMTSYSNNILDETFPFDSSKFVIAGGFPTNLICGLRSTYTDIDIYIYKDFNETCKKIIDHLSKKHKIELTHNQCIINVILVGNKMNLQLINSKEVHQEVIDKFDLTYSQALISNWNTIEITLEAFYAYLTGTFEINSNVRINPSRILKAYVKGFKMDNHVIRKAINFKIDDDAKNILDEFKTTDDISKVLEKHLQKDSVNFKILTKSIYLPNDFYEKLSATDNNEIKKHLESITQFKYLKANEIESKTFNPLEIYGSKYYGGYDHGSNNLKLQDVASFTIDKCLPLNKYSNPSQWTIYPLKVKYVMNQYSNITKDMKFSFSTVIDPTALQPGLDTNLSIRLNKNHPLVDTIKKIEDKLKSDMLKALPGKTLKRSKIMTYGDTVYIPVMFNRRHNKTYTIISSKSKDKCKTYETATNSYDSRKYEHHQFTLEKYIEESKGKTEKSRLMITLTLNNLSYSKYHMGDTYSYNITLQHIMIEK
jgi:hypothetical protein